MRYLNLIKYKLALAVTLTCATGYIIASGGIDQGLVLTCVGLFLLAGGAAGLNQYQERKYDSMMLRTKNRPIPAGQISPGMALLISLLLALSGFSILLTLSTGAALLGLLNLIIYNLVYTYLKRISYVSIIPGALVGAIPPIIGWLAAGSDILNPVVIFLATLIFLWQIPHFWILLIKYNNDYSSAGYPTILKSFDEAQVKRIIFVWIAVSSVFVMAFPFFGIDAGRVLSYVILLLNILFIAGFYFLLFGRQKLRSTFILSNVFITIIFLLLAVASI